jgi:ABC-type taurine transport system ATPase subunit
MGQRRIVEAGTDRVVVFQDAANALFPWLRAHENVEFGLAIQGGPDEKPRRRRSTISISSGCQRTRKNFLTSFPAA